MKTINLQWVKDKFNSLFDLGLGEDATEQDIIDATENLAPVSQQVEEATSELSNTVSQQAETIQNLTTQVEEMNTGFAQLQDTVNGLVEATENLNVEETNNRITELEGSVETLSGEAANEAVKEKKTKEQNSNFKMPEEQKFEDQLRSVEPEGESKY